jgi:hypothetical protein
MSRPASHQVPISYLFAGLALISFGAVISHQNGHYVAGSYFNLGRGADVAGAVIALLGVRFIFQWIRGKLSSRT